MVEEKLEVIQAFSWARGSGLKKGWGGWSPGFLRRENQPGGRAEMCHASEFFLQRHRGGVADSRAEGGQSSSSTMKTKAEGVLRLGPNVRQVHTVKDQKATRTLQAKPCLHTGSAGLQRVLAVS